MRWRVSSAGPDWTDIRGIVQELQQRYSCSVMVTLMPAGGHYAVNWRVVCVASWFTWENEEKQASAGAHANWPSASWETLEGCVTALLYRLEDTLAESRYPGTYGARERARGPLN